MLDALFYAFSAITLVSAAFMVLSPNAVNGAMAMIAAFVGTAALFILLEAFFLAILQVLVYAGAVMVLFLFIIMLLDVDREESATFLRHKGKIAGALGAFGALALLVAATFAGNPEMPDPALQPISDTPLESGQRIELTNTAKSFGYSLFTKYLLPLQVTGFLLLAAMVGVIVVSKRQPGEARGTGPEPEASEGSEA